MKKIDPQRLAKLSYVSQLIRNAKEFFTSLSESFLQKLTQTPLKVEVSNQDTNLLKETAENTRKANSKLQQLVKKEVKATLDLPKIIDVKVTNPQKIEFPHIPEPLKEVRVSNLSDIKIPEAKNPKVTVDTTAVAMKVGELKSILLEIQNYLPNLKASSKAQKSKEIVFPSEYSMKEGSAIIEALQGVRDDLGHVHEVLSESGVTSQVEVTNFPPQHIPTPVTNINLNSLRGVPLATAVTVGTSATPLPATALTQRRSLIVYNNSANTIYIGGVDVTTSTGLPIDANMYSPPIDAGQHMIVYAVAGSSSNVRVLEVSNDAEGN